MIIDLLYTAGLIGGFFLLGFPFVRFFLGEIDRKKIFISTLSGFAIAVIVSSWLAALGIDLVWDLPALIALSLLGFLGLKLSGKHAGFSKTMALVMKSKDFLLYAIPIAVSGGTFIFLQNNSLWQARISVRNGPDLVGWMSAAKYFCVEKSLAPLANRIRDQLGILDPLMAFRNPYQYPLTSSYRLPSLTDQINGEFLIGAHRYGTPGLQAAFCRVWGEGSLYHVMVGLMAVSAILVATLAAMVMKNLHLSPILKVLAVILCAVNLNLLSVSMEGGFGQLLVTPFLLFLFITLVKPDWREEFSPVAYFLFVGFSLATYLDGLFILLVFAPLYFVIQGGLNHLRRKGLSPKIVNQLVGGCVGLLAGWPIWSSLPRLFLERLHQGGVVGGWDQGRFPLPTDFWGLTNWLPPDGAHNIARSATVRAVELIASVVLIYVAIRSRSNAAKFFIISSFVLYLAMVYIVYKGGFTNSNNYAIWKMSAYLGPLIILAIAGFLDKEKTATSLNAGLFRYRSLAIPSLSLFLVFALVASIGWSKSWKATAQPSFPLANAQLTSVLNNYDTEVAGFSYSRAMGLALLGDLHYMIPSRGFNIPVDRSNPPRELAYILPTGACQTEECLQVTFGQKPVNTSQVADGGNIIQNGDFALWSLGKKGAPNSADNWTWVTGSNSSIIRKAFAAGTTPEATLAPKKTAYYPRWKITGDSRNYEIFQRVKGVNIFQGQTVVLTFWARQLTGSTSFQTRILQDFGTGGTPSPLVLATGGGAFLPTKVWSKFTQTFTIPSVTAQELGTNKDSSLWVDVQITSADQGLLDLWGVRLVPAPYQRIFTSSVFNIYK